MDAPRPAEVREPFSDPEHRGDVDDPSLSAATLATLARAGDVEALAGLLDRYRPSLYAAAIGLLRDRDDALDAVQDTCLVALLRFPDLRDPAAVGGWLHAVLRNACLQRYRRATRERERLPAMATMTATATPAPPGPEEILEQHALGGWLWTALHELSAEERITVLLRYFTRATSYASIAAVTGVPVGTVRSRLHHAKAELSATLRRSLAGSPLSHLDLERDRRQQWEQFYADLHEAPLPRTYQPWYAADVEVTDGVGRWRGVEAWSAHERDAIALGVRATIVGLVAARDVTILEIDFANPAAAADHCPPRSTFVHHLSSGRSRRLAIHYV
jgi:RNA polymerase sigma-70 factor (ECF subfamily)